MTDQDCIAFLQWALPRLGLRWPGLRKVRRQVHKRINRRLEELGLARIADYRSYLDTHPDEWHMLDSLTPICLSSHWCHWPE
jgi:chemotaxis protein methyltransferase CheR